MIDRNSISSNLQRSFIDLFQQQNKPNSVRGKNLKRSLAQSLITDESLTQMKQEENEKKKASEEKQQKKIKCEQKKKQEELKKEKKKLDKQKLR